jgi:hypothetical protein
MPRFRPTDTCTGGVAAQAAQAAEGLEALKALHDSLRHSRDRHRRAGRPVPRDLCARLAACEADLMEARFDNMPV